MIVFLTEQELELSKRIADIRNSKNGQVPNYRVTRKDSDWAIHFAGSKAEVAGGRVFGFPPDIHFSLSGDDHAPDLYYRGLRLEIKAATYSPAILKLNFVTDFVSDVIVLAYVDGSSRVDLTGCVSRARFGESHYVRDFGYGPRACMDCKDMASVESILNWQPSVPVDLFEGKP